MIHLLKTAFVAHRQAGKFLAKKATILVLGGTVLLGSKACMPEDELVAPLDRGGLQIVAVHMGSNYHDRVYFDLSEAAVALSVDFSQWDLEFACQPGQFDIKLNSAKFASVSDLGVGSLEAKAAEAAAADNFLYDVQSGDTDSTAMSIWWQEDSENGVQSRGHVYVLDRGYSAEGKRYGKNLFTIEDVTDDSYTIGLMDIDGSNYSQHTIVRDARFNFIGFDVDSKTTFEFEPPRDSWDLVFSKYAFIFREPEPFPYSVNGVLTNPYGARAAEVSDVKFEDIKRDFAANYEFSSRPDAIGHDWKTFILQESLFIVHSERNYIVKDVDGFLYKLRFTDFYDAETGNKGSPTFELQSL